MIVRNHVSNRHAQSGCIAHETGTLRVPRAIKKSLGSGCNLAFRWHVPHAPVFCPHPVTRNRCGQGASCSRVKCSGSSTAVSVDQLLNQASNNVIQTALGGDEDRAWQLSMDLDDLRRELQAERPDAATFVVVLQGLLSHTVKPAAHSLEGPYLKALNRICNTIQGSGWTLVEEGQSMSSAQQQQPQFTTYEDIVNKKKAEQAKQQQQQQQQQRQREGQGANASEPPSPHTAYYDLLQVPPTAPPTAIKAAFRQLALKWHPDVNSDPQAAVKFIAISNAYDVLSDPQSRKLYDLYGEEGMQQYDGARSGSGNSSKFWDEFKPFTRSNKSTKARAAAAASSSSLSSQDPDDAPTPPSPSTLPAVGELVEYPLSDGVKAELQDGRSHGLGLLVSRNMDRGDRKKIPVERLDLCEVEPLRQEEPGSNRWMPDELAPFTLCRLGELKVVPVVDFDRRFDVWVVEAELSPGCGGPEIVEEVML